MRMMKRLEPNDYNAMVGGGGKRPLLSPQKLSRRPSTRPLFQKAPLTHQCLTV